MKALTMFDELGFKLHNSSESFLLYKFATDYDEILVHFDLELKRYYASWSRFIYNHEPMFVPMNERPQHLKHSAKYGHWQAEMITTIDVRLHNAIHQQMIELGWIKCINQF